MNHQDMRNRLADETSPYLKQHAANPVLWQPWDEAALACARAEDKPILLSIGYSACHWCHVMAHESFEDAQVAAVMNDLYICIKVDREERPDLDKIYQAAHSLLTRRSGGWPLTMVLAPHDLTPFFGGTYFPKEPRFGLPAFTDILTQVAHYYKDHREELAEQAPLLRAALKEQGEGVARNQSDQDAGAPGRAVAELKQQFDRINGGFGGAPKFPHPSGLRRLLIASQEAGDEEALAMVKTSLNAMATRGLYDHLEGGFFRYSVDGQWSIPHFEKMLYDNAQLIPLYAEAYQATGVERFKTAALESGDWIMTDMQAGAGGYYATLDADSEGEEGTFYLWQRKDVEAALSSDEAPVAIAHFGLDCAANFEGHAHHLVIASPLEAISTRLALPLAETQSRLKTARAKLTTVRARRTRPARDEKILSAWNGLMIKGMARAGRLLDIPRFIESARRACDMVAHTMWDKTRLAAVTKDGRTSSYGYLDDCAFLLDGVLELLMAEWRDQDLVLAQELARHLVRDFQDIERGGFYFTPHDHEALLYRPKPFSDDALPAGNAIAAKALLRLSHLLAEPDLETVAIAAIQAGSGELSRYASIHATLIEALEDALSPPPIIILRGEGEHLKAWHKRAQAIFAPRLSVFAIPHDAQPLPPGLGARAARGPIVAYVCQGLQCGPPITDEKAFLELLTQTAARHTTQERKS